MEGYSLDIKLEHWTCACSEHPNGFCAPGVTHTQIASCYNGAFGDNREAAERAYEIAKEAR